MKHPVYDKKKILAARKYTRNVKYIKVTSVQNHSMYMRPQEAATCRLVEKVDDAIPTASVCASVESCTLSSCAASWSTPSDLAQWKQRIMFSPRREIALNVVMPRLIRFARNNATKTGVKNRWYDGNTRLPAFAAVFSPSRHYRAKQRTCAIFFEARPIKPSCRS